MAPTLDDRAALAKAYHWASQGMTVALGMVAPGMIGYFIDHRLGTRILFTIVGFAFGMTFGIWRLIRLGRAAEPPQGGPPTHRVEHPEK